ncbi:ABC transporter permease, partial [Ruminococcaceae bacterium OttesenSCG-928-D13]|nr:ABC transporter permease [Ruminococcaceae bacterium OttesenSCG-928-D13]
NTQDGAGPQKRPGSARLRRALRRVLPAVAAVLIYLALAFFMFQNALDAARPGVAVSLRYPALLTTEQVRQARFVMGNPEELHDFAASYWYESELVPIASERGSAETPALFVDGDIAAVQKVNFVHGTYPGVLETRGLAVSEGLAWTLFGGTDVIGTEIEWLDATYTVRGVFAGDEPMLMAQVDAGEPPAVLPGFAGVELVGALEEGDPREAAETYAQDAGLGTPTVMVDAQMIPGAVGLMAWVPALVLVIWAVARLLMLLRHAPFLARQVVLFGVLLALAFLIPKGLSLLPGWMIPNQWSDFDHWTTFFQTLNTRLTDVLSLTPNRQDVHLKKLLIAQFLLLIPALFSMTATIRMWGRHIRRGDLALRRAAAARAASSTDGDTEHEPGPETEVDFDKTELALTPPDEAESPPDAP